MTKIRNKTFGCKMFSAVHATNYPDSDVKSMGSEHFSGLAD